MLFYYSGNSLIHRPTRVSSQGLPIDPEISSLVALFRTTNPAEAETKNKRFSSFLKSSTWSTTACSPCWRQRPWIDFADIIGAPSERRMRSGPACRRSATPSPPRFILYCYISGWWGGSSSICTRSLAMTAGPAGACGCVSRLRRGAAGRSGGGSGERSGLAAAGSPGWGKASEGSGAPQVFPQPDRRMETRKDGPACLEPMSPSLIATAALASLDLAPLAAGAKVLGAGKMLPVDPILQITD